MTANLAERTRSENLAVAKKTRGKLRFASLIVTPARSLERILSPLPRGEQWSVEDLRVLYRGRGLRLVPR